MFHYQEFDELQYRELDKIIRQSYNRTHDPFFISILVLLSIFFGSIFIATLIISNYLYQKNNKYIDYLTNITDSDTIASDTDASVDSSDSETEPEPEKYENKYPIKTGIKHISNPSHNTYITENTPNGLVFMQYNVDEEGFYYWANHNIQFKYLETVARKYVNMMQCCDYYVSREDKLTTVENIENIKIVVEDVTMDNDNVNNTITDIVTEPEPHVNSPFATLKNYSKNNSKNISKNDIKQYNACKFIKRGSINDLNLIHITTSNTTREKNIDFASFKALFMEKDKE